jgi:chromosome segregation ATPase
LSDIINHISLIHNKLQQLLKQYELLQKENASHVLLIDNLKQQIKLQNEKMDGLQQQNLILKASVTHMEEADKKALEQKIQQYIKNIDKCISLLSQ